MGQGARWEAAQAHGDRRRAHAGDQRRRRDQPAHGRPAEPRPTRQGAQGSSRASLAPHSPGHALTCDCTFQEEGLVDPTTKTIVIHPGSRWLRIGRASDAFPLSVPNVIASRTGAPPKDKGKAVDRVAPALAPAQSASATSLHIKLPALPASTLPPLPKLDDDGEADMIESDEDNSDEDDDPAVDPSVPVDPIAAKISSIRGDLRARMRSFKLRGQGNGNSQAAAYNASVVPEPTPDYNDPNEIGRAHV